MRLTTRLIVEQNKVLLGILDGVQGEVLGWCRQGESWVGKPCWLGIRGEDWKVLVWNVCGEKGTRADAIQSRAEVQVDRMVSWTGLSGENVVYVCGLNFDGGGWNTLEEVV
jgi:hypothetical protein